MYVHTNIRTDRDLRTRAHSRKFPHTLAQTRTQRPMAWRCPAARREKLPARLWISRWTAAQWMGKISMWKANEKYISPQEKDNTCAMRLQTSSKTAHGIAAIQCGASPKPRLAHMLRCIIRARRWRRPNVFLFLFV